MPINITNQIQDTSWDKIENDNFPFLSFDFFNALEKSGSVNGQSGWNSVYFEEPNESILYTFVKDHSYGEYIFDWDWANTYHSHNIPYYPKLTSMIPFTSATTQHFVGKQSSNLMKGYEQYYLGNNFSSSHFLFIQEDEINFFKSFEYKIRESFQYHFVNSDYQSFEDFLSKLKNKKAKQIRKERVFSDNIDFQQLTGNDLNLNLAREMYGFYLANVSNKQAIPYLTESFFVKIFENLKDNILYVRASQNETAIAGALYFYSSERLYGRYWGSINEVQNLHFELCYYQGIEFCIKNKLSIFEAGAQGEHKIARGFKPVRTYSAHKLKDLRFNQAVTEFIDSEKEQIGKLLPQLSERLPFK
jgi:predicted N-acyltransferase